MTLQLAFPRSLVLARAVRWRLVFSEGYGASLTQVEWTELVGEQAETLLAVLLYNEYPEATRVRPSRGDYGIDVLIPTAAVTDAYDVYQIKKFAQSLTANQKAQVEDSLRRLLIGLVRRSVPLGDWYLVMPLDPTIDNFLDWFNEMPERVIAGMFEDDKLALTDDEKLRITEWRNAPGRVIKWEGRPFCMTLASKYGYVVDYYLHGGRDRIVKALADLSSIYLNDLSLPNPSTAVGGTPALLTPAEVHEHLFKLQEVLDTDPHFRYGISIDPTPPEITTEPDLVAVTQMTQPDGRTVTVRIKQRFAEALRERPIPMEVKFLTNEATFDEQAFEMWRKYGMPLTAAPAEVDIDLPGGLGAPLSGGVTEVTALGSPGHEYDVRFRIRDPDGVAGDELSFTLAARTGPDATGIWETGTDSTGLLTFDSKSDLDTNVGTWSFQRGHIVGREVVAAMPVIEFLQAMGAPNVLQAAAKYGPYADYHEIPEREPQFPESVMALLRALATIQPHTPTPILIPDFTTVTVEEVRAVTQAAALVSGQAVIDTWDRITMAGDGPLEDDEAGPAQEIDFQKHYELLVMEPLVVKIGNQSVTLGTVSWLLLSARYEVQGQTVVARPFKNNTVQKNFSPLPNAAGSLAKRVLGRVIGPIDNPGA